MKIPRGSRSDIGFQTTSPRVVDDPQNYAKEFPIRNTRNPKPHYKIAFESLQLPTFGRSKVTGRGEATKKVLTPRRKSIVTSFISECSSNSSKYGRIGSLQWMDELCNQINTPGSGRGSSRIKNSVSHSDVQTWLDHADIVDLYENLKETQTQKLEPVQLVAGTSGGVAKDKDYVVALPPKKRVRIRSPSTWGFISPPISPSLSYPILPSTAEKDPLYIDENTSPLTNTPSSSPSGEQPMTGPISPLYSSSLKESCTNGEISSASVTVVKKNLSDDDLREEAAAVAEELTASSVEHHSVIVENAGAGLFNQLTGQITEHGKNEEYILPTGGNVENQDDQQNMNQDQSFGITHQNGTHSYQEQNVFCYERCDFQVQHEPQSTYSIQGMDSVGFEQQITGAVNYNGTMPFIVNCAPPTPSPDQPSCGPLNLVQNQGQIPSQSSFGVSYEERRVDALHQAFRNLHNSIDSVRVAFNGLYVLNYQERAPTAMLVFGHILDSMISFYVNYMRPGQQ